LIVTPRVPSEYGHTVPMANASRARHVLRAKGLADARYYESLSVADLAAAAHLSPAATTAGENA